MWRSADDGLLASVVSDITGGAGVLDVCEKDPADAADCLSPADREVLTASSQVS